jgi:Cft2 family RNA processing exonuclease
MRFVSLGASDRIGASCHLVQASGTGILLDAGVDPDDDGPEGLPRLQLISDDPNAFVDHVVITHAHHDHIGGLPVVIRKFPHVQVHMTRPTRDLAEFVLPASARLQKKRQREGTSSHAPMFDEHELEMQSYIHQVHELRKPFQLRGVKDGGSVSATLHHSGHILGGAGVMLEFGENGHARRLFYTGDTNLRAQTITPAGSYPDRPVDVLVLESTLGADAEAELTTRRMEEDRFGEALRRAWDRGGSTLVPVFAIGRAQEVLALIHRFKKRRILPDDVPVYTAGSMRAVAELYDRTRFVSPRLDEEFLVEDVDQLRLPRSRKGRETVLTHPAIFVVSSGMMLERTLSNRLAQRIIGDAKNAVLLVGFSTDDSPAAGLLAAAAAREGDDAVDVVLERSKGPQPLRCEVDRFRLSGHSHRRDLIRLVEYLAPRSVILVHGESPAQEWMADNIDFFYPDVDIILPETGKEIEL